MAQPNITVEAGSGGRVGKMTQAAVVSGGVGNKGPAKASKEGIKTDLSKVNLKIKGPSDNIQIDEFNQFGIVEGGINNTHTESNTEENSEADKQTEEEPVAMEQTTLDNPDGLL